MAFASFMTTKRVFAFTIVAVALSTSARLASSHLDALRLKAANLESLTATAIDTTIVRMSEKLHGLASEPTVQRNLQWNYANSVSQTLAAAERAGELDHLAIIDGGCEVIANSKRQALDSNNHWKPICKKSNVPAVSWHSKNGTPVLQIATQIKSDPRDTKFKLRWIVGQVAISEAWLKQHNSLDRFVTQNIPEASFVLSIPSSTTPHWTPMPWRMKLGLNVSHSLVLKLEKIADVTIWLVLFLLCGVFLRSSLVVNRSRQTSEKNRLTLEQLIANAASDDETKLSFSIGYAATASPSPGDMTPDLITLDRLHRNRFAMSRMDVKEKDLWIEDLQCQLAESQVELNKVRGQVLRHSQNELIHDGLAKTIATTCRSLAIVHDDINQQCNEQFLGLSNLIASWKHGSQSMGLKRFTRYLQESTDELSRRSDLETGLLILTGIQEQAFSTLFNIPGKLKQSIQELRPAIKTLNSAYTSLDDQCSTTMTVSDILTETSHLLSLASQNRKIVIRPCSPELQAHKVADATAQIFIKWLFYRCLHASHGATLGGPTYITVRGKEITDSAIQLLINFVFDRQGHSGVAGQIDVVGEPSFEEEQKIHAAIEIADKLAVTRGIDWQDQSDKKTIAGSFVTDPAILQTSQLTVKLPIVNALEWGENTTRTSKMVRMASVTSDFRVEKPVFSPGI